jgi:hypothetical protein
MEANLMAIRLKARYARPYGHDPRKAACHAEFGKPVITNQVSMVWHVLNLPGADPGVWPVAALALAACDSIYAIAVWSDVMAERPWTGEALHDDDYAEAH